MKELATYDVMLKITYIFFSGETKTGQQQPTMQVEGEILTDKITIERISFVV